MASRKAAFIIVLVMLSTIQQIFGAGECGKTPVNVVAKSLSPCIGAANNAKAKVAPACCAQVTKTLAMPRCMCAVFLSPLAKQAGINLGIAITIPKRCNIKNRPMGKKCGRYVVP
ncbi:hypothetical protein SUGI_0792830 [Cryptomeria japonica]|uniref:non-specific lipid-transfer protein n=1 Tax=Cryptomeria japonica TaxID=3369 RepID=UPI002414BE19|nr:non-specific lipid-transfer protein [Cryptomeria japonica]GLJ38888.1 hypothetical protein SUGI_0792830 [Cryptomeria japonica]